MKLTEQLKKKIISHFEEQFDESECPECKSPSLSVILDFVGDHLEGEGECLSCGAMMPVNIEGNSSEALAKVRKAEQDLEKMMKKFGRMFK